MRTIDLHEIDTTANLIISTSGGKDSQAMQSALLKVWQGDIYIVHADLGRAEWDVTPQFVHKLTAGHNAHMVATDRDLITRMWERHEKRPDAPSFPSSAARWCTSDLKRAVIDKWVRNTFPADATVYVAMGLRAEESPARAKKPRLAIRNGANAPTKNRQVWDWNPIHHWTLADVWEEIGYTLAELEAIQKHTMALRVAGATNIMGYLLDTFKAHPAYALGNERLSCALCVLASRNDLANGAQFNPDVFKHYVEIEVKTGFSFTKGFWLGTLRPELLTPAQVSFYEAQGAL